MARVITMGEIMLRLSTPGNEKFIQADEFDINYGGGEANVAVSLANYGHDAAFVMCNCSIKKIWRRYEVYRKGRRKTWYLFLRNWCFYESIQCCL